MDCTNARPLIPSYLDGELSEAQAGPLRKHLLDCQPCRGSAQGEKNLKRWFVADPPLALPRDFAARVARRAFAGDTGERWSEAAATPLGAPVRAAAQEEHLAFLLRLTAVAAAVLAALSIALGGLRLPASGRLMAETAPEANLERALDELDRLNREESPLVRPVSGARATDPAPAVRGEDRPR